jgi:major outer membrane protein P.IB
LKKNFRCFYGTAAKIHRRENFAPENQATLAALAAVAATGAARADVTVYGVVDVGVTQVSGKDSTGKSVSAIGLTPSNSTSTSRLGFKSSSDLGNGLTALAQLESNAKADAADKLDWARSAFVGLIEGRFR